MTYTAQAGLPFSPVPDAHGQLGGVSIAMKEQETYRDMAERIYEAYPRKVARPKAIVSILKAGRKYGFPMLAERTNAYAAAVVGMDPQFVPHPTTWFNQERFRDDPATWNPQAHKPNGIEKAIALEEFRLCRDQIRLIKASYDPNQTKAPEDRTKLRQLRQREKELKAVLGMKV